MYVGNVCQDVNLAELVAFSDISPGRIGFLQGESGSFQCTTRVSVALRWIINDIDISFGATDPIGSIQDSIATAHLVNVSVDNSFEGNRVSLLIIKPDPNFTGEINVTCSNGEGERVIL